jgi:nucleotide-binding universal stress UspA family protein
MLKDILVHLDGSQEDAVRLSYALELRNRFGAVLTAVLTHELPQIVYPVDGGIYVPTASELSQGEGEARGAAVEAQVRERLATIDPPLQLVRIDATPEAVGERVAALARASDLFIASRPMDASGPTLWRNLFERVLFTGGRAVLVVPRGQMCSSRFANVTIAWNGTRQAARALSEAMPFLASAETISVVLINPPLRPAGTEERPGDEVLRYLSRYGKTGTLYRVASNDKRPSDALLSEARRHKAELIVMGGYGKSSLLQWVLGGVSEEILTHGEIPLLMAN